MLQKEREKNQTFYFSGKQTTTKKTVKQTTISKNFTYPNPKSKNKQTQPPTPKTTQLSNPKQQTNKPTKQQPTSKMMY